MNNVMTMSAADQVKIAQVMLASRTAEFVATLPVATQSQVDACVESALAVKVRLETAAIASGRNQKFRLTEEQADQVAAARAEHKKLINEPERRAEAVEQVRAARELKSYKLRVRKDGTVTMSLSATL
jgi:hypothetical protein